MPDARRSMLLKLVNSPLHAEAFLLDQIAADEEPRSIESIMTVHANQRLLTRLFRPLSS